MDGLAELTKVIDERGSRSDFAKKAGISEPYLSNILSGRQVFSRVAVETAMRISVASGLPIERIAGKDCPALDGSTP